MGLLDALLSGDTGGGLLDFLRGNAMNQQMPSGLPSDQAQYGQPMNAMAQMQPQMPRAMPQQNARPSPLDNAQWPAGPVGAPMQANAQMPPQQPPAPIMAQPQPQQAQQPQDSGLGIGDRLGSGFRGMMANAPAGPLGILLGAGAGLAGMGQGNASNLTAKALLAKGVDPTTVQAAISNPELMKTLVTQAFGPQTVTALGNGYVADKNGKITRAYEPEDKIPSGFSKGDDGNMHFVPGGPADPAYLRLKAAQEADPNAVHVLGKGGELYKVDEKGNPTVVHKNESNVDASLDDPTATMMAQQYLAGDKTVLQNVGRGAQGSANLIKIRTAIKSEADKLGLDGNGIAQRMIDYVGDTARERTAATQEGRMSPAGIEAHGAISLGRVASDAVPRGNWVPVNQAVQAFERGTSDPALRAFGSANTTIINTYARAINPNGVGTVADKEHAREMLSTADGPAAYKAVLDQLDKEIEMAHQSPGQARAGFKQERNQRLNGGAPDNAMPGATTPAKTAAPAAPPLPKAGDIQGGYRFKGGNPADKNNWEQAT